MCFNIGVEEIVGNALIEIVEKTGRRTVSFLQLNQYEQAIITQLKAQKIEVALIFHRDLTNQFLLDYSDIFEIENRQSEILIRLKNGISVEDLRNRFRIKIAFTMLKAFISDEAVYALIGEQRM